MGPDPLPQADPVPGAEIPPAALYVGGFGSNHPGGANFALGDGSVRFIRSSIDPQVFRLLGHRADGEVISDTDY